MAGEHGIGKRRFLPLEHASSIEQTAAVKRLFDPSGSITQHICGW